MKTSLPPYRLMTPGPVPLTEDIQASLALPMIHHRTREFTAILVRVLGQLKVAFQTAQPVLIHSSTGSGAMESALVNTLSPGDDVLFIVAGKFGERWEKMGKAHGLNTHSLVVPPEKSLSMEEFERSLKAKAYKAICSQACESSTGAELPIENMATAIKKMQPQALFLVDAISGLLTMPLEMDQWGIDVLVAGGQKGFGLPAGLAFIALSEKAWTANQSAKCPRFYFDLLKEKQAAAKGQTLFSSPVSHIRALDSLLNSFDKKELQNFIAKAQLQANTTRTAGVGLGLKIFSNSPSSAVTALELPIEIDGDVAKEYLEDQFNITVAGGQDLLKGRILRIGHLGPIKNEDLIFTINALGKTLLHLKMTDLTAARVELITEQVTKKLNEVAQ